MSSTKKKDISLIKQNLLSWGFTMLDESEYKNTHGKINIIDTDGYKYFISYDQIRSNVKIGSKLEKIGKVNPYAMENLQLYIQKQGSNTKVIDTQYHNTKTLINLICGNCGNQYKDTYDHIRMKGHIYCQSCGIERRASTHRHQVENIKQQLATKGYKLLNENFQTIQNIEVEDKDGYRSSCANFYLLMETNNGFTRNHKQNLYTPYNIDLYLKKQGILTEVADITPRHIEVKKDKIGFICSCCGKTFYSLFDVLKRSNRVLCQDCSIAMSNLEYKVKQYLDENNIAYETQKRFPKCKKKRCLPFDFYLTDYNYVIEVHGQQHYYENECFSRTLQEQQEYDEYKKQFCINNNIGYLELPFWLINNPPQTYKNKINEIIKR